MTIPVVHMLDHVLIRFLIRVLIPLPFNGSTPCHCVLYGAE